MNHETRIEEIEATIKKALHEIEAIKKDMKEPESEYPKDGTPYFTPFGKEFFIITKAIKKCGI